MERVRRGRVAWRELGPAVDEVGDLGSVLVDRAIPVRFVEEVNPDDVVGRLGLL